MKNYFIIRPSKDIRTNYGQISALSKECPIAITVNGKEDTVLMSHEEFTKQQIYIAELEAKLAVYTQLAQSMDDIKLGRTYKSDSVFETLIDNLEHTRYDI